MSNFRRKYKNKKTNSKKENIPFKLSYDEYIALAKKANITSEDIGIKGYHLSRYK